MILKVAEEKVRLLGAREKEVKGFTESFEKYLCGYYVLDELINDESISDIKCYAYNRIMIKRYGQRSEAAVSFKSEEDYLRFVKLLAIKNEVNLSLMNAIQKFTDYTSNPRYILRFNIMTELINSSRLPCIHIRKEARSKYTLSELVREGFLSSEQSSYLEKKVIEAEGILFTGKGSSGKTTLLNTLLECIPKECSGLVVQESDELFSTEHRDILFQHVREKRGEGRISYDLCDLTSNALLIDVDYFIIGEIKGKEAKDFIKASYTGYKCWTTVHGRSQYDGLYKLADYVKQATEYTYEDCLRLLTGIDLVVFLKDWQVKGIAEVRGYNSKEKCFDIVNVDLPLPLERVRRTGRCLKT